VALRTQQLIAYESGVADTVDPLGGSYYIESLTDEIERRAAELIREIDEMGGAVAAVERGYIQQEIQESSYLYQKQVESGERVVVGMNRFQIKETPDRELLQVDPAVRDVQIRKIAELREFRDAQNAKSSLENLKKTAAGEGNLMIPILDCVRSLCTLGEICNIMREAFGEYKPA
jgi:methylmalonyl-CoA mutase N-terminal domain/subunit